NQGTPPGTTLRSDPAVVTYRDAAGNQRIYAFARGDNGRLYVNFWDGAQWRWADQGKPSSTTVAGTADVITYPVGTGHPIDAFLRGSNNRLYVNFWDPAPPQWYWANQDTPVG